MTGEGRHPERIPMYASALSLPPQVIGDDVRPIAPPVPVRVWIPNRRLGWVQHDGEANAYTRTAGHVRYWNESGQTDEAWVWAGAITRRERSVRTR